MTGSAPIGLFRPYRTVRAERIRTQRLQQFFFGIYPYIALSVFFLGSFDREQYTWKADSSHLGARAITPRQQPLSHIGILALFAGHFVRIRCAR